MKTGLTSLLFITAILLNSVCFAQDFNAGILAGVNASQVSGDNYSGFNKAGILAGIYTNLDVGEKVNFQLEINYSQKGSRKNPNTAEGDHEFFLLRLNYIDVPLMVKYFHNNFSFEGGVYYGRLFHEHMEDEEGVTTIPENFNQFKRNDVGALIGINYNFTDNINMNWRFNNSILPIRDFDSGESYLYFKRGSYHTYLSFSFRYTFFGG